MNHAVDAAVVLCDCGGADQSVDEYAGSQNWDQDGFQIIASESPLTRFSLTPIRSNEPQS